jgi:DNA-binding transcriptional MerR regulator
MQNGMRTVGEAAELAGVSVRTLRYYDRLGLLRPQTTPAGYRLYGGADLEKLWQILFFRELGFPLRQIKKLLADPRFDRGEALVRQRALLHEKKEHLERLIASIDETLAKGFDVNMLKTFDMRGFERAKKEYAAEAAEKYGETWRESEKRTAGYTEKDWADAMAQAQEIYDALAAVMEKGAASDEAQALVGRWREYISARFYECTPEILRGLGEMYVGDERFTRSIDRTKPGLAAFLHDAIGIYCERVKQRLK